MAGRRPRADSAYTADAAALASAIRSARHRRRMTQERLAWAAGLSLSTVRKIETGEVVEPGFFPVMTILSVLGVEPSQLELSFTRQLKSAQHAGRGADRIDV